MAGPAPPASASQAFLYRSFHAWVGPRGGVVVFSALRLRVREGMFREPDLLLLRERSDPRCQDRYWLGADLVVEVVSPDRPERDLVDKRIDYAEAGIPEYWVVDPRDHGWLRRARHVRPRRRGRLASAPRIRGRRGGSGASALRCRTTCRRPRSSWERRCPPRYLVPSSNWACAFPRSAAWMSRAFSVSSMSCASPVPMAGVAPAAGRSCPGREPPFAAGPDGCRSGRHRTTPRGDDVKSSVAA